MKKHWIAVLSFAFTACVNAAAPAAVSTTASGSSSVTASEKRAAEGFKRITKDQFEVESFFPGPSGMIGLVAVSAEDQSKNIAWATSDGSHFLLGALVDEQGINYTTAYADKLGITLGGRTSIRNADGSISVATPDAATVAKLAIDTTGKGKRDIYVVIDPLCPHCRHSYEAMANPLAQQNLTVHWLLATAVGGPQSDQLIEGRLAKKKSLSEIMTADREDVTERPLATSATAYLTKTMGILDAVVHQRAVPAVIYQDNGVWLAKTGFNPMDYLPPEVVAAEEARQAKAAEEAQAKAQSELKSDPDRVTAAAAAAAAAAN